MTISMRRLRSVAPDAEPAGGDAAPIRVAFATQDLKTVNAHFAGARTFAVYEVTADGHRFREAIRFDQASAQDQVHADGEEDRITPRADALEGCAVLFVLAIGGPAAAKVVNRRIHPIKLPAPEPIAAVLDRVQEMLRTSPPPWLRKALGGGRSAWRDRPGDDALSDDEDVLEDA